MNINFPPVTADGQPFSVGNLAWVWNSSKIRWESSPISTPFPISLNDGGTSSSTVSGALQQLGVSPSTLGLNFATINEASSGLNTNLLINPAVAIGMTLIPGFKFISIGSMAGSISGTGAGADATGAFGSQINIPSTRGWAVRSVGGTGQLLLTRDTAFGGINWNKTIMMAGRFRVGSAQTSAHTVKFLFGGFPNDPFTDDWIDNRRGFGIKFSGYGTIQLVMQNGPLSSFNSVDSNFPVPTFSQPVDFMIINRAGNIQLFINEIFSVSSNMGPSGYPFTVAGGRIYLGGETTGPTTNIGVLFSHGVSMYFE